MVLQPVGGATNVTHALLCNPGESRMICAVDLMIMNKIKWIDTQNLTAMVESGIIGTDLEKELGRYGMVCGHEPDSVEFSTLGG